MMLSCKAKITQFHIVFLIKKDILRLKIPMNQSCSMQIMQSIDNLVKYFPFFLNNLLLLFFAQVLHISELLFLDVVLEILPFTIFHLNV
jgi:hypothetical protein